MHLGAHSVGNDTFCMSVTSLPSGMPLPREQVRPMTLATKVLKVRYSFSTTPLRMVFISGIPEPAGRQSSYSWLSARLTFQNTLICVFGTAQSGTMSLIVRVPFHFKFHLIVFQIKKYEEEKLNGSGKVYSWYIVCMHSASSYSMCVEPFSVSTLREEAKLWL